MALADHRAALKAIFDLRGRGQAEQAAGNIDGVGHRVVHGGEKFSESVVVDDDVMGVLQQLTALAPLHNPPNLLGIEVCREMLPGVPNVAVFDTALHQTMPPKAYLYALPLDLYRKHGIRRYGFHGTSHALRGAGSRPQASADRCRAQDHHLSPGQRLLHHRV